MNKEQSTDEIARKLPKPWELIDGVPTARWKTDSFRIGAEFVSRLAATADELNHHPDVLVTYPEVKVTTISHDVDAVTDRDLALAEEACMIAQKMGLASAD